MRRGNYDSDPEFDDQIIEDYRRASAADFTRPPASLIRQPERQEQFTWPEFDQQRDTVSLEREELREMVTRRSVATPQVAKDIEDTAHVDDPESHWVLDVLGGSLFLLPGIDIIVGRRPAELPGSKSLTITDPGRTLSKSHARLTYENGFWLIEDLGSTNGTAILPGDDIDISTETLLEPGRPAKVTDRFRLGTLHVRLRQLVA